MRTLLALAAAVEGATGLALMLHPPIVTMLLLVTAFAVQEWRWVAWPAFRCSRWEWRAGRAAAESIARLQASERC